MKKAELEIALAKSRNANKILRQSLINVRQVGRDTIKKGTNINSIWVIEEITESLTRADEAIK